MFFRKLNWGKYRTCCVCEGSAHPSMAFVVCSNAQQTKYSFECPLKLRRKDKCALLCFRKLSWARHRIYYVWGGPSQQSMAFIVFWEFGGKISVALLCFRKPSRAKHCMCCVFPTPSPTKYALLLLMSKAPPSEASYLLCLLVFLKCPSNVYHLSLRFRRPSPA